MKSLSKLSTSQRKRQRSRPSSSSHPSKKTVTNGCSGGYINSIDGNSIEKADHDGIGDFGLFDIVTKRTNNTTTSRCSTNRSISSTTKKKTTASSSSFVRSKGSSTRTFTTSNKSNASSSKRRSSTKGSVTSSFIKDDPFLQSILQQKSTTVENLSCSRERMGSNINNTEKENGEEDDYDDGEEEEGRTLLSLKQVGRTVSKKIAMNTTNPKITNTNLTLNDDQTKNQVLNNTITISEYHNDAGISKNKREKNNEKRQHSSISNGKKQQEILSFFHSKRKATIALDSSLAFSSSLSLLEKGDESINLSKKGDSITNNHYNGDADDVDGTVMNSLSNLSNSSFTSSSKRIRAVPKLRADNISSFINQDNSIQHYNIDDNGNNSHAGESCMGPSNSSLSTTTNSNNSNTILKQNSQSSIDNTKLFKARDKQQHEDAKRNLIQVLNNRSIHGNNARRKRYALPKKEQNASRNISQHSNNGSRGRLNDRDTFESGPLKYIHKNWNMTNYIVLNNNNRYQHNEEITCMEFDKDGVLLAVGDSSGYIQIFDFDEVNSTSLSKNNNGINQENIKNIRPCIQFRAGPFRISGVKWNPANEDLLIVSFFNSNEISMFDITSSSSNNKPLSIHLMDANDRRFSRSSGYTALAIISPSSGVEDVTNKSKVIAGGSNGSVKLWEVTSCKLRRGSLRQKKPIWSIASLDGKITEILQIELGLVLLATTSGSFYLFDIDKCTRKSFASLKTPEQIKKWNIQNPNYGMANQMLPKRDYLGVKKCHLVSMKRNNFGHSSTMLFDLIICLKCGWVIKMQLDVLQRNGNTQVSRIRFVVIHKPSFVNYLDDEGNEGMKAPTICVPEFPIPSALMIENDSFYILIADVRPIDIVLPNRDKRVQGNRNDGMQFRTQSNYDNILIVNPRKYSQGANEVMAKMNSLSSGKLKHMAMHPDNIWLVVAIDNSIRLMQIQSRNETLLQ